MIIPGSNDELGQAPTRQRVQPLQIDVRRKKRPCYRNCTAFAALRRISVQWRRSRNGRGWPAQTSDTKLDPKLDLKPELIRPRGDCDRAPAPDRHRPEADRTRASLRLSRCARPAPCGNPHPVLWIAVSAFLLDGNEGRLVVPEVPAHWSALERHLPAAVHAALIGQDLEPLLHFMGQQPERASHRPVDPRIWSLGMEVGHELALLAHSTPFGLKMAMKGMKGDL